MDNEKRGLSRSEYNGRFGSSAGGNQRPTGSYRTQPAGSYRSRPGYQEARDARRPTGFGSIDRRESTASREPSPEKAPEKKPPEEEKAAKRAERRALREARRQEKAERPPRKRRALKALLIALAGVIVLLLALTLLFGGGKTYHQLPTVERESAASFAPDATPAPGAEVTA